MREAAGGSLSLREAEMDPRLAGVELGEADADGDGRVRGERELSRLFDLLDRYDGRRDGRVVAQRAGRDTAAAPILDGVADALDVAALRSVSGAREGAVVLVGMSETSVAEARALRRGTPVLLVHDVATERDVVRGGDGNPYDLRIGGDRHGFVASLGVPAPVARGVERVLAEARPGARRELGELSRLWAPAERGEPIPRRLVVSGHGDSRAFFGDDHDRIDDAEVAALAAAMPRAAARIHSLHLAACQHGYDPRMETFRRAFPNLRSIWGYAGFSPSGWPARHHQGVWERATRDLPDSGGRMAPSDVAGTRRAAGVAIWTRERGYVGPDARELGVILDELNETRDLYERYRRGELDVTDPGAGPLARRYQSLQEVVNHLDWADQFPSFQRSWAAERDAVLRLRFFASHVTHAFDRHYARDIAEGYGALGLSPPRFGGMSRREALAEVARFRSAFDAHAAPPSAAWRLRSLLDEGLAELRAEHIPTEWL